MDKKTEDFYAAVSAIAKFIEEADASATTDGILETEKVEL